MPCFVWCVIASAVPLAAWPGRKPGSDMAGWVTYSTAATTNSRPKRTARPVVSCFVCKLCEFLILKSRDPIAGRDLSQAA